MTYGCVVLVVGVLATVTTAMDRLQTSVGELQALKDLNGVAQCATSPPNTTVTARSKIDCMRVCRSYGCSCAYGANYHSDTKTCELHGHLPDSLVQVPNCVFYQVSEVSFGLCSFCAHYTCTHLARYKPSKQNNNLSNSVCDVVLQHITEACKHTLYKI